MLKEQRSPNTPVFPDTSVPFTDEHFYVLDSVGLYHYKNFLSKEEVAYANAVIDKWLENANPAPSKFPFFLLDYIFCQIMTKKWVVDGCLRTVGPWYRLDHCVGIQQPGKIKSAKTGNWVDQGYEYGNIHGGNYQSQGSVYFQSFGQTAWSGHMTFGISLIGQNEDDGGFIFQPGSHKSSSIESGSVLFKNLMKGDYNHQSLYIPKLEAGDAVFFPENINHGMKPMKPGTKRRAIYYKFVPGFLAWRSPDEVKDYATMARTQLEKNIVRPPYVAKFEDTTPNMSDNFYRERTA
jgi:hypothetical protein